MTGKKNLYSKLSFEHLVVVKYMLILLMVPSCSSAILKYCIETDDIMRHIEQMNGRAPRNLIPDL